MLQLKWKNVIISLSLLSILLTMGVRGDSLNDVRSTQNASTVKMKDVQYSLDKLCVEEKVEDNKKITEIANLGDITQYVGINKNYDKMIITDIYRKLGFTENQMQNVPEKDQYAILNAEEISTSISYGYLDLNDEVHIIAEDEFREKRSTNGQGVIKNMRSGAYTENNSDPCFTISVTMARFSNGRFMLQSNWTCYDEPSYCMRDFFGMTHVGLIKEQNTFYSNYSYKFKSSTVQTEGTPLSYSHTNVADIESPQGQVIYVDLVRSVLNPAVPAGYRYTYDRTAYMSYYATLAENTTYSVSCSASYLHTYSDVSPSLGLSFSAAGGGSIAPSITPTVSTGFATPLTATVTKRLIDF